jgi:hypothetical protein
MEIQSSTDAQTWSAFSQCLLKQGCQKLNFSILQKKELHEITSAV